MGLFSILAILVGTAAAPRRLSLALAIRNDNYGGGLIHRATLALEAQLEVADEVVVLDFNTVWPRARRLSIEGVFKGVGSLSYAHNANAPIKTRPPSFART